MMTAENKNELDSLLALYERTSCLLDPITSDASMLATVTHMVQDGKDEMALYVLHNIKPYGLEPVENGEEKDELGIDIDGLLNALFG